MDVPSRTVVPVILSGGTGTRLWPMSRELFPKQLLPLLGEVSLLQQTAWRVHGQRFAAPVLVCNQEHRFVVAEQLRALGIVARAIVLEPAPRNTAPAIAAAAVLIAAADPDALMLVCPADHAIDSVEQLQASVEVAADVAARGRLVAFGIPASSPETGYGYIRAGAAIDGRQDAAEIAEFVEKPDAGLARQLATDPAWRWNSGMFMFPPKLLLDELKQLAPDVVSAVSAALKSAHVDLDFVRLGAQFEQSPAVSIDHAVMERTDRAAVVGAEFSWSDVGSWSALWEMSERNHAGNVFLGDVISHDTADSYVRADGLLVATVGLKDTIVVATSDAVLVADRSRDQDVRKIVERLKGSGRSEASAHRVVYRPWGSYEAIDAGPGYQVKHIIVRPGHQLSLQKHAHRAEHWVVISGTAEVVRGDEVLTLRDRMSVDVPLGCVHRLGNPGPELLHLVEVQTGSYLGEDDIVRLEDAYGRHGSAGAQRPG